MSARGGRLADLAALATLVTTLAALVTALACHDAAAPSRDHAPATKAPALRAAVTALLDEPTLERAVASLRVSEAGFARAVVPSYRGLYAAYTRAFAAAAPGLAAELGAARARGPVATVVERRHYAGDASLSLAQARTRWAQPLQSESWLVEISGHLVDTVWVQEGAQWRILLGLDEAALAVLTAAAPACGAAALHAGAPGPCSDAVWSALDGALRGRAELVERACARAQAQCQ
ncbi:MAG: hypothetical protein IPI49_14630 [Myxococcales bacterium]|nr:hypothetical protein [Myxococcales bacterium]